MHLPVQSGAARIAVPLIAGALACPVCAAQADACAGAARFTSSLAAADAVPPEALDRLRGGFVTPGGMTVTLGIERIVTIDGRVASQSTLQLGDLGRLASGAAAPPAQAAGLVNLIRDGAAGPAIPLGPSVLGGTVIQNSLNNQLIQNATILNASVNAQGLLQALHFQATLSNALNHAATAR